MPKELTVENVFKHPIFDKYTDEELAEKLPYAKSTIEGMRRGWLLVTKRFKEVASKSYPNEKLFRDKAA